MAEFSITGELVFPTRNDVGPTLNKGKRWSEETLNLWLTKFVNDFVSSGFTVPATDPDLTLPVAAGEALLNGYFVQTTAPENVTVPDATTTYIFLRLKKTSSLVTEAVLATEATATPTGPEDLLLAEVTASGGAITATRDLRNLNKSTGINDALIFSARGA